MVSVLNPKYIVFLDYTDVDYSMNFLIAYGKRIQIYLAYKGFLARHSIIYKAGIL